ncbi:hypothetical protein EHS25_001299 [Saitozyma podzolica]|uniref:Uncharacterized protein n=1 Tax=Saitozyma podzolica TaxID=1890683 RepID=A0A427YHY6_9TREE|nr:hypothetical protein EHS25_001299 [Saitozyma podzolica]
MRRDRSGGEYRAEVTSIPTTAVRANASPARSSGGGAEHGSISLGDTGASGGNQRGTRRTTTPLSTPLPTARGVRNKATQSQPLSTVSPPPTPSATPSATPSESLAFPSPDPPEASPIRRSNRARPQPAVGDEEPAASTSQLAKRTRRSHFSIASTSTSTPTASSSTTRRQHDSDQFPQSVSQSHPQSHSRSHSQSHTQSPQPSRPDSVSPRHTPPETTARRTSCQSGRSRFQWPKLSLRPAEELQAMWDYFLSSAYSQLNLPVPPNTGPGQMDTVQRGMVDRVHGMWVEARSKYMRRNLDHMSIMVSTWTTAREFNLSARALRRYYDANKHRIIDDKGPYVPSDRRPSDWPFHDHEPENIEAKAWWIYDWGTKKCAQFLGLEGDDEVANERRRVGSVAEADALEMDHEDTLESDEDDDESFGAVVAAETEAEMEALGFGSCDAFGQAANEETKASCFKGTEPGKAADNQQGQAGGGRRQPRGLRLGLSWVDSGSARRMESGSSTIDYLPVPRTPVAGEPAVAPQ